MKNANIISISIGVLVGIITITCSAQSFMNYGNTPNTSGSAPKTTPGGKIATISPDDFKNKVTTLGRKNQEKLAQQVQAMIPPSSVGSSSSGQATTSTVSSTGSTTSSSPAASASQPAAAPAPRNDYTGFGTGSAPASSGGSSGSGGFGIKY